MQAFFKDKGRTEYYSRANAAVKSIIITPVKSEPQFQIKPYAEDIKSVQNALTEAGISHAENVDIYDEVFLELTSEKDFQKALNILEKRELLAANEAAYIQRGLDEALESARNGAHTPNHNRSAYYDRVAADSPLVGEIKLSWADRTYISDSERPKVAHDKLDEVQFNGYTGIEIMADISEDTKALLQSIRKKGGDQAIERLDDMNLRGDDLWIALEIAGDVDSLIAKTRNPTQQFCNEINNHPEKFPAEPTVIGGANRIRKGSISQGCQLG